MSFFSKDSSKKNGHCSRCKKCESERIRIYHLNNRDKIKKYYKDVTKNNRSRESERKFNARWRDKNKHKMKAHKILRNALISNELDKEVCKICGKNETIAHHDDYSKPLEVDWLCLDCHGLWHQILNEWERQGLFTAHADDESGQRGRFLFVGSNVVGAARNVLNRSRVLWQRQHVGHCQDSPGEQSWHTVNMLQINSSVPVLTISIALLGEISRGFFILGGSWCPDLNNSPVGASDTWFNSTNPPLFSPLGRNLKGVFCFGTRGNYSGWVSIYSKARLAVRGVGCQIKL